MPQLVHAEYGKANIRLMKVVKHKEPGHQDVVELIVSVSLQGDIATSYTQADNSVVVATDSMKQTTYILAKQHPISPPELFAAIVAEHFTTKYSHIHSARVNLKQLRWSRMTVEGSLHPHSFLRDGTDSRNVEAVATHDKGITLKSGIAGLLVLKSTGSAFHSFIRDEYTLLPEVQDRILSTEVESSWTWEVFPNTKEIETFGTKFDDAWNSARTITLDLFATENSPSVQNTMYKMCERILKDIPKVQTVEYSLPNKHYFDIDLSWHKGLKNTGHDAEVYAPQSDPNGLIQCTVSR